MTNHIQIGDVAPRIDLVGDGAKQTFPFPFPILNSADLTVLVDGAPATIQSVTGAGQSAGGAVTLADAPIAGTRIAIQRAVAVNRTSDFQEGGDLRADVLNSELDRIVMMAQDARQAQARMLKAPEADLNANLILPPAADRADKFLAFDSTGAPKAATHSVAVGAVSSAMAAFVSAGNTADARDVLGGLRVADVKADYGAVGDGLTDDTNAIRDAVRDNLIVYFPPGAYVSREPIRVRDKQHVFGASRLTSIVHFLGCSGVAPVDPSDHTTDVIISSLWLIGSDAGRILATRAGDGAKTAFTGKMPGGLLTPDGQEVVVYVREQLAGQGGGGVDLTPYVGEQKGDNSALTFNWTLPGRRMLANASHLAVEVDGVAASITSVAGVSVRTGTATLAAAPADNAVVRFYWRPLTVVDDGDGALTVNFLGGYAPGADDDVTILWAPTSDNAGIHEQRGSRWTIADCFIQDFSTGRWTDGAPYERVLTDTFGNGVTQSWAWALPADNPDATLVSGGRLALWREIEKQTATTETRSFDLTLPNANLLASIKHLRVLKNGVEQKLAWGETLGDLRITSKGRAYQDGIAAAFSGGGGYDGAYKLKTGTYEVERTNGNVDFEADWSGWTTTNSGAPGTGSAPSLTDTGDDFDIVTATGRGKVAEVVNEHRVLWDDVLPIEPGRRYRVSTCIRQTVADSNATPASFQKVYIGMRQMDGNHVDIGTPNNYGTTGGYALTDLGVWQTIESVIDYATVPAGAERARPQILMNNGGGDGTVEIAYLKVTEEIDGGIISAEREQYGWGYRSEPSVTIDQSEAPAQDGVDGALTSVLDSYKASPRDFVIDGLNTNTPKVTFMAASAPQAGDVVQILWREPNDTRVVTGAGGRSGTVQTTLDAPASGAQVLVEWTGGGWGAVFNNAYQLFISQQNQRRNPNNRYPLYGWRAGGGFRDGRTEVCGWFGGHAYGELIFGRERGDENWDMRGDGVETRFAIDLPKGSSQINRKRLNNADGLVVYVNFQRVALDTDYVVEGVGAADPEVVFTTPPEVSDPIQITWIDPNQEASIYFESGQGNSAHGVGVGGGKYGYLFNDRQCTVSGGYIQLAKAAVGFTDRAQFNRVDGSVAVTVATVADLVEDKSREGFTNFFGDGAAWPIERSLAEDLELQTTTPINAGLTAFVRNRRRQGRRATVNLTYTLRKTSGSGDPEATFSLKRWDPKDETWVEVTARTVTSEIESPQSLVLAAYDKTMPEGVGWVVYRLFAAIGTAGEDELTLLAGGKITVEMTDGLS